MRRIRFDNQGRVCYCQPSPFGADTVRIRLYAAPHWAHTTAYCVEAKPAVTKSFGRPVQGRAIYETTRGQEKMAELREQRDALVSMELEDRVLRVDRVRKTVKGGRIVIDVNR